MIVIIMIYHWYHLCSEGVTWGKVVSLYAVAGGLAVDCVRHGHPAMVHTIVDCMGEFVRKSLTSWLKRRGGWVRGTLCFYISSELLDCVTQSSTLVYKKKRMLYKLLCQILFQFKSVQFNFIDVDWWSVAPFKQNGGGGGSCWQPAE